MNKTLLTDLYQLTMMAAYLDNRKNDQATFELFIRNLPAGWGYCIANGIEDAIDYITDLRFNAREIAYLKGKRLFKQDFLDFLKKFKFRGEVYAVKEGTPVFAGEPILRVTAKRTEAQLVETALLNIISFQILVATKASRVVQAAARGRATVVDFGLRRAQGSDAGMKGARAAYIAGAIGTSNVKAGMDYGIPIVGTQSHAFIMSFPSELDAFRAYARTFPDRPTLLIDTYDTLQGARHAAIVAKELEAAGGKLGAVRLDSGDLGNLARRVRKLLDNNGLRDVKIVASSDLNEYKIAALVRAKAPIDVCGVGTEMITARPVAALSGVYKLVEDAAGGKLKLSREKKSMPGTKQVYRRVGGDGKYLKDVIALRDEPVAGRPLLTQAVTAGRRARPRPALDEIRQYCLAEITRLPEKLRALDCQSICPVAIAAGLKAAQAKLAKRYAAEERR